jgi:uncharacterized protein YaiI (UPF0178 family)
MPLAAEVIEKGGHALNPRGDRMTFANQLDRLLASYAKRARK